MIKISLEKAIQAVTNLFTSDVKSIEATNIVDAIKNIEPEPEIDITAQIEQSLDARGYVSQSDMNTAIEAATKKIEESASSEVAKLTKENGELKIALDTQKTAFETFKESVVVEMKKVGVANLGGAPVGGSTEAITQVNQEALPEGVTKTDDGSLIVDTSKFRKKA